MTDHKRIVGKEVYHTCYGSSELEFPHQQMMKTNEKKIFIINCTHIINRIIHQLFTENNMGLKKGKFPPLQTDIICKFLMLSKTFVNRPRFMNILSGIENAFVSMSAMRYKRELIMKEYNYIGTSFFPEEHYIFHRIFEFAE